ncbi:hypothetical protein C8R47DRAFT_407297 [Mycena vitilis]|nr:hypothetical protein C8R47DRAFT_302321 [Mycena vitilis]KAJ6516880.1 hypothetical protein C8R47DRAFT_407297 [Mycena vitilis]
MSDPPLRPHLLKAFLQYYHTCSSPLSSYSLWKWVRRGHGLNAQQSSGRITTGNARTSPVRFTVFGMVKETTRLNVIELERPHWDIMDIVSRDLVLHYDMQLLTLSRALDEHGWESGAEITDHIVLTSDIKPIEPGSLLFATVLLTVREYSDQADEEAYVLEVVELKCKYSDRS